MRLGLLCLISAAALVYGQATTGSTNAKASDEVKRIQAATAAFEEMVNAPDGGIATDIMDSAHCIAIVPNLKRGAFFFGGRYGRGLVTCRTTGNNWSAPSMIVVEGGSFGLQFGGGEADIILAVMNRAGQEKLTHDKFTIGGDVAGMAGPVGREVQAQTDAWMKAQILSWSRAHGLFAGVSVEGASVRPDNDANAALYGADVTQRQILHGDVKAPAAARPLLSRLERYVPKEGVTGE